MKIRISTIATTAEIASACSSHSAARCQNGAVDSISRGGRAGGTFTRALERRFCRSSACDDGDSSPSASWPAVETRAGRPDAAGVAPSEVVTVHENTRR